MRLNQYLAKSGIASRRKAEKIIKNKKVSINDECIDKPYYQVKTTDRVKVNNEEIKPAKNIYILANKPKGVTTTCSDKFAKTTILDLIPKQIISFLKNLDEKRIYPVGRLDKNSTGLIILTNDGDFCYQITHPKFEIEKEYLIELSKPVTKADCHKAKRGVLDKGELLKVKKTEKIKGSLNKKLIRVIVAEGKKRHLRRLFNKLGYKVNSLKRTRIGNLKLNNLAEGEFKIMLSPEIKKYLNLNG
ncbi:MAG: rRNA pseudouridine synthase [Candidatus Omnitrophica bacterium]|nr:rRNA pseudouridine synthase [Candidatus Omnitrophota bacterium]MCF7876810.1 rRNA pseudouridine synthase [Candidatus Omnitrophota bacterium]MCF7878105.1 rRNA pseudouridine synthase [Candidatus Omnitrophota bacterium]MCF7892991.1 rRNA pseudouridine synthase [Candidatus Omnitrophota bacterium]